MAKLAEVAIFTEKVSEMSAFYKHLLNVDPVTASQDMAIFMSNGTKLFIHRLYEPEEGELPPENHLAFNVPDVDATSSAMVEGGHSLEVEPADYYWGRSAYLRDPSGQLIELIQAE